MHCRTATPKKAIVGFAPHSSQQGPERENMYQMLWGRSGPLQHNSTHIVASETRYTSLTLKTLTPYPSPSTTFGRELVLVGQRPRSDWGGNPGIDVGAYKEQLPRCPCLLHPLSPNLLRGYRVLKEGPDVIHVHYIKGPTPQLTS